MLAAHCDKLHHFCAANETNTGENETLLFDRQLPVRPG
jgi:hypothetical protein